MPLSLSDIDECAEGSHDCEQECVNEPGSFTCSCRDGYEPLNSGKSCVGMCTNRTVNTSSKFSNARDQLTNSPLEY